MLPPKQDHWDSTATREWWRHLNICFFHKCLKQGSVNMGLILQFFGQIDQCGVTGLCTIGNLDPKQLTMDTNEVSFWSVCLRGWVTSARRKVVDPCLWRRRDKLKSKSGAKKNGYPSSCSQEGPSCLIRLIPMHKFPRKTVTFKKRKWEVETCTTSYKPHWYIPQIFTLIFKQVFQSFKDLRLLKCSKSWWPWFN